MAQKYGYQANGVVDAVTPCLVCDDPSPSFSWTDLHGEGYCVKCGTPYQLKGQETPQINIKEGSIPLLREYWAETGRGNGLGQFLVWQDYPDQLKNRQEFNQWSEGRRG